MVIHSKRIGKININEKGLQTELKECIKHKDYIENKIKVVKKKTIERKPNEKRIKKMEQWSTATS